MEDFKDLRVWVKAHALTLAVHQKTRAFPKEEMYGLTSQLRRASASVGANIAEGCGRRSDAEMRRFVQKKRKDATYAQSKTLLDSLLNAPTAGAVLSYAVKAQMQRAPTRRLCSGCFFRRIPNSVLP